MEKKKEFIQVFNEIAVSAYGQSGMSAENEAQCVAGVISYGLDALGEFGGVNDFRTVFLMDCIREKFDPKDSIGKQIHEFMFSVNTLLVQANRNVWDYAKISKAIRKLQE